MIHAATPSGPPVAFLPAGPTLAVEGWAGDSSPQALVRRYLDSSASSVRRRANRRAERQHLLGRVAVKEAVCRLLDELGAGPTLPADLVVSNDADGRPHVEGARAPLGWDLRISVAHSGVVGAGFAAVGRPVGVDVERVEPRGAGFERLFLTPEERALVVARPDPRDLVLTRWWAAKEAVAKARGTGLQGRPSDFPVTADDGELVQVGGTGVVTWLFRPGDLAPCGGTGRVDHDADHDYVAAWTVTGLSGTGR